MRVVHARGQRIIDVMLDKLVCIHNMKKEQQA